MKTAPSLLLVSALATALTACDKAKETAAEAKAQAAEAVEKAKPAVNDAAEKAKDASSDLFSKTKELAGDALKKGKELGGEAVDFTKEKLGIPETDGLIEGLGGILSEARDAVKNGKLQEKAGELKTKWDAAYAKAEAEISKLAPEKQEKLKAILQAIKTKWDELTSQKPTSQP